MGNATMDAAAFAGEAYGKYAAGQRERSLSRLNSFLAERQAQDAISRGNFAISRVRRAAKETIGTARTGFAGQNVLVSTGTALDTQASIQALAEEDVQQIRINAAREAWGYRSEAIWERFRGEEAAIAGRAGALQSLTSNLYKGGYLQRKKTEGPDASGDEGSGPGLPKSLGSGIYPTF